MTLQKFSILCSSLSKILVALLGTYIDSHGIGICQLSIVR